MGSKRQRDTECSTPQASVMNVFNGETYNIENSKEFVIGRSKSCSIIIEEIYISRRHCVIRYEEGQFFIVNYNNGPGTCINCKQLPKDNELSVMLKHGDLISFSLDNKQSNYIYKFCVSSITNKKLKLDEFIKEEIDGKKQIVNIHEQNDGYVKALDKLQSEVSNLKIENLIIANQIRNQLLEFQNTMNEAIKYTQEFRKQADEEVLEQKAIVENLLSEVSEYQEKLRVQQDITTQEKESYLQMFKTQVFDLLENDCQCPICNEILLKPVTANCNHTFCEGCITRWLSKNKICPVCRSNVQNTNYCLVMDNFITNVCDLLGGTAKLQRDNLKKERSNLTAQQRTVPATEAGRRRRAPSVGQFLINMDRIRPIFHHNTPVIDLTNSTGPSP